MEKTKEEKARANKILKILIISYPDASIELEYDKKDSWQLLVVVLLSAQSTDKGVNKISKALFSKFTNMASFAKASPKEIEPYIKSLGLYRNKARNLVLTAQKIMKDFHGLIPNKRTELEKLFGIGKKSSAVIVATLNNEPALAVDTHVMRLSMRLGLSNKTKPSLIEEELCLLWPKDLWLKAHHVLIWHGRRICKARRPKCSICVLEKECPKIGVKVFE